MWMEQMISVGKVQNGFLIECRVPFKPNTKKTAKMESCCCSPCGPSSCERQYVAKDAKEIGDLIADIMPLLDQDFKTEDEFDAAFKKATADKESQMEDKKEGM